MAVQKIQTGDSYGDGFNIVNNNADELIVSASFLSSTLTLTKNGGGTITVEIPITTDAGYITVVDGQIVQHDVSGEYNQFDISPVSYFYNGSNFNISTTSTVTLATNASGNPRLDAIVIDTATNTIIKKDGTASSTPELPTIDSDEILLGVVLVKNGALSTTKSNYILTYSFFEKQLAKLFSEGALQVNALSDLTDTTITSPSNNQLLVYNSSTSKWTNQTKSFVDKTSALSSYLRNFGSSISTATYSIMGEVSNSTITSSHSYINAPNLSTISSDNSIIVNPVSSTITGTNNLFMGGVGLTINADNIIYSANNGLTVNQDDTTYIKHLRSNGGIQHANTLVGSGEFTLDHTYYTVIADNSDDAVIINLPASPENGQTYLIKAKENNDNLVNIDAGSIEFETGDTTYILNDANTSGETIKQGGVIIQFNLAENKWFIISDFNQAGSSLNFENGVENLIGNQYGLGGTLTKNTNINKSAYALNINNSPIVHKIYNGITSNNGTAWLGGTITQHTNLAGQNYKFEVESGRFYINATSYNSGIGSLTASAGLVNIDVDSTTTITTSSHFIVNSNADMRLVSSGRGTIIENGNIHLQGNGYLASGKISGSAGYLDFNASIDTRIITGVNYTAYASNSIKHQVNGAYSTIAGGLHYSTAGGGYTLDAGGYIEMNTPAPIELNSGSTISLTSGSPVYITSSSAPLFVKSPYSLRYQDDTQDADLYSQSSDNIIPHIGWVKEFVSTSGLGGIELVNVDDTNKLLTNGGNTTVDWANKELKDYTGTITSLDWNFRSLYDSSENLSLDWTSRILKDSSVNTAMNWEDRIAYDSSALHSIDWEDRILYSNNESIDWKGRFAYDTTGHVSIDWTGRKLIAYYEAFPSFFFGFESVDYNTGKLKIVGDITTVDWFNGYLLDTSGNQVINWSTKQLKDDSEATSIDWDNRVLNDSSTNKSVDWEDRKLTNSSEANTIDWENLYLYSGGTGTVDWGNGYLNDAEGNTSIDWKNREVYSTSGVAVMNYKSDDGVIFNNTGAIVVPKGTTAQRPANPIPGMIRFNTETNSFEGVYNDNSWAEFAVF